MNTTEIKTNDLKLPKYKFMTATTIKLIAAFLMVLDHIHQMYAWNNAPLWLTMLGRPVFPMFLFIAADSFYYTKNRKSYLKRLLFASWFMTISTTLLQIFIPNENVVLMNHAFSTFFMVGLYIQFWDWFVMGIKQKRVSLILKGVLCSFIPFLTAIPLLIVGDLSSNPDIPFTVIRVLITLCMLIPNILFVEGGILLVALGVFFYIFRNKRIIQVIILLALSLFIYIFKNGDIQWLMCFAAVPMLLYNGQRGKNMKNFFYIFYPAHIFILYLMASLA